VCFLGGKAEVFPIDKFGFGLRRFLPHQLTTGFRYIRLPKIGKDSFEKRRQPMAPGGYYITVDEN
jgi:hypothetical protein